MAKKKLDDATQARVAQLREHATRLQFEAQEANNSADALERGETDDAVPAEEAAPAEDALASDGVAVEQSAQ